MIKKYLFGIGITFLSLLGNSLVRANLDNSTELPYNFYTQNVNNIISKNLSFENSQTGENSNNWLYMKFNSSEYKTIFWNSGKIYIYYRTNTSKFQGYYNKTCLIYSEDGVFGGNSCQDGDYQDIDVFYNLQNPNFTKVWIYPESGIGNLCFYDENTKYFYCFNVQMLTGNLNIPSNTLDFTNYAGNSPFGNGTGNETITINTQCPTIGQLMANMGNNYNTGLCYNNTTYFNGTTFETIDKQDIFTIFNNDYENYTNRVSIYQQTCKPPATTQACQTAFSGEYKKYSIIANAYNSNVDEKKLRNYCNMGLNYNPNTSTCIASGYIKEDYTPEERLDSIIGTENEIPTPNTNIFNSICEGEQCYEINRNFLDSLINIYEKLTGLFRERNGVEGIIPPYILRITFVTILFTIIFKK